MLDEIRRLLAGVRTRQRLVRSVEWVVRGAALGSATAVGVEISRMCGAPIPALTCWWVLVSCMLACGALGWMLPVSWSSIAHLVDTHYRLKDSAASALDFAARPATEPLMQLQIASTIKALQQVDPRAVLPSRFPRLLPAAAGLGALLIALPFLPRERAAITATNTALQQIVSAQAKSLDETMIEQLRELAEETQEPELQALVKEMEKLVQALKSPEVDEREALAMLSEMQQNLADALNQFNAEKTDANLKALAAALESAESLQAIAEALKGGEYAQAAEQLEKIDTQQMTPKERDAVAENLKTFNENPETSQQKALSEGAQELQEGLEKEDPSQFKDGASRTAEVCKQQDLKKSIASRLNAQLNRLSESKSQLQAPGAGGAVQKSTQDSNKIGKAASNKPLGEQATKLDSQRRQENVTGVQGEGASERETAQAPTGEQDATRNYRARYTEFRKQMEEVLDSEPLPLGHRETVRKYFEAIHPNNAEAAE